MYSSWKNSAPNKKLFLGAGILFIAIFAMLKEWLPAALLPALCCCICCPAYKSRCRQKEEGPDTRKEADDLQRSG